MNNRVMSERQPVEIFPGEVFANVADFDLGIRRLIPRYDEMLEVIVRCTPPQAKKILELGSGTGELSLKLLRYCQGAKLVALDYSPRMSQLASLKLESAGCRARASFWEMDFGDWANNQGLDSVGTGFDACVSSLAIHHLTNEMKLKLFQRIHQCLKPGGVFWNADPILPESPQLAEIYKSVRQQWAIEQETNLAEVRSQMGTNVDRGHSSQDQLATLEEHRQILCLAGFKSVAVPWKHYGLAVFGGYV